MATGQTSDFPALASENRQNHWQTTQPRTNTHSKPPSSKPPPSPPPPPLPLTFPPFPCLSKPRLPFAFTPQLCPVTCSRGTARKHRPSGGPCPVTKVDRLLSSHLPRLLRAYLYQDPTMLPQPPDLNNPVSQFIVGALHLDTPHVSRSGATLLSSFRKPVPAASWPALSGVTSNSDT